MAADDLRYLSACIAIDLTGVRYALPVPRAHEAPGADHHWQWDTGRTEDGWTGLYEVAGESHHDDSVTQELRDSLAEEFVMLRIENVVEPHTTSRQASEHRADRIIAVHHRELLPTQIRTTQNPAAVSTAQIGAAQIAAAGPGVSAVSAASTAAGSSGASGQDGIGTALAAAARSNRAVALALSDGTRLNGVPQLDPDTTASGIVRVSEEHGQEPFTVRLDHVIYVRVLGGLGAPGNSGAGDGSGAGGSRGW